MTSIPSTNPSPIYQDDKNKLNEVCLRSFVRAFSDICPKIIFIFDHCDREMYDIVARVCDFDYGIQDSEIGINGTMLKSYELAAGMDGNVLFQECDYLYQNRSIGILFNDAIDKLEFVSPYDHRNFYLDKSIHSDVCRIALIDDHHFRTTERNTMTWGTKASLVRENLDILLQYGYLDNEVWSELAMRQHPLWVPIPSFATHMATGWLSPGIDWKEQWNTA